MITTARQIVFAIGLAIAISSTNAFQAPSLVAKESPLFRNKESLSQRIRRTGDLASIRQPRLHLGLDKDAAPNGEDKNSSKKGKSLVEAFNDWGQSLKPRAKTASNISIESEGTGKTVLFYLKSSAYYILFMLYRAYRGFFVLLPSVFRRVYDQMESMLNSPDMSLDESNTQETGAEESAVPWRTKLTVSIVAAVITFSYVLGGALRVATRFVRAVSKTSSVPKSLNEAAEEFEEHEDRIKRLGDGRKR